MHFNGGLKRGGDKVAPFPKSAWEKGEGMGLPRRVCPGGGSRDFGGEEVRTGWTDPFPPI